MTDRGWSSPSRPDAAVDLDELSFDESEDSIAVTVADETDGATPALREEHVRVSLSSVLRTAAEMKGEKDDEQGIVAVQCKSEGTR